MRVAITSNGKLFNVLCNPRWENLPSFQTKGFQLESLSALLQQEGVTQVAAKSGSSPLHEAIEQNEVKLVEKMLQAGLSPKIDTAKAAHSNIMKVFH